LIGKDPGLVVERNILGSAEGYECFPVVKAHVRKKTRQKS